ncbi:reverse transcriptase domain-containing protein [Tanacetum coccineum]|uniref:Reverse transcriptase domain-containing protein n=1 Tax=Tanacetum coccineum TaxID=301880 RepID=A0ABQ5ITM3_9ASTR
MHCSFLYFVSCVMIDNYVAFLSFRHCRGVIDWIYVGGVPLLLAFACSRFGALVMSLIEMGELNIEGEKGRRPREDNDERVNDLNGQGNDQGLGANGGVEGVNGNVEGVNRGVGGAPDFSTIIAQQLQNLLPVMLAQVGNQGNVGNQNGNVVNENVQENVGNVLVNGNWNVQDISGCSIDQKVKYTAGSFVGKALTWWNSKIRTLSREVVVSMSWNDFKLMMIEEFCPSHEMQKLETELWNHVMVGAGHAAYTDRFHELARSLEYIANQRSKGGKRFGFIRFLGIKDASDFVKSLSNICIESFHLYVSIACFQRANHTRSQPINKVLKAETNPKPNPNPNSSSFQNSKPHPSFAFVLHTKPNPATTTPSQAITHSVILNDHDLIRVEDSSTVILVKLKDVDSIRNMCMIYDSIDTSSHINVNEIEKVVDSVEENSVNDLNDLNENLNEMAHGINKDKEVQMDNLNATIMEQTKFFAKEKDHNDYNMPNVGESSDPSQSPGFEHMKKSFSNPSLIDLPIRGRLYTWFNKAGTKLSKLDRFLISDEVLEILPDIRITALDRLWSDHTPILFHILKCDIGSIPFKLYNSWLSRDGFDDIIKAAWSFLENNNNDGRILKSHEKFWSLKASIKQWYVNINNLDRNSKHDAMSNVKLIEKRIDDGIATPSDLDTRMQLFQEIDKINNFDVHDLIQKAYIKWDIEGDENSNATDAADAAKDDTVKWYPDTNAEITVGVPMPPPLSTDGGFLIRLIRFVK